jgi:uncharacterized LabA/DUF88 family protein
VKKVCVFVDGENFRHSIVDLFEGRFSETDYLPKNADWREFFDWLVVNAVDPDKGDVERVRTYWYVCQMVDYFPYRYDKLETDPEKVRRILSINEEYKRELEDLEGEELQAKMAEFVEQLKEREAAFHRRSTGWTNIQDAIAANARAVEFRRAGAITYNLFQKKLGREKAVDVKLATDLIVLRDIYDVAVILSGDQDYVPAVQYVKDTGKRVVNVSFKTRGGGLLPGGARRLNQVTDWPYSIPYEESERLLGI